MADETAECLVCLEYKPRTEGLLCANKHYVCAPCFSGSIPGFCESGGQFVSEVHQAGGSLVSNVGQLPCMLFSQARCNDANVPVKAILRCLLEYDDALATFRAAEARLISDVAIAANKQAAEREAKEAGNNVARAFKMVRPPSSSPVLSSHHTTLQVTDAMTESMFVRCPRCSEGGGQKNEEWFVKFFLLTTAN
jgi:hypothetical protein